MYSFQAAAEKLSVPAGKGWKKSRVQHGFLIKRIPGYTIVEDSYGVSYLFVLSRKPDRTRVDKSKYPASGYFNWRGLKHARLLVEERKQNGRGNLKAVRAR